MTGEDQLQVGIVDGDTHYYEPRDAFTRHVPKAKEALAVRSVADSEGGEHLMVGDRPFTFLADLGKPYATKLKPGGLREMMRKMAAGGDRVEDLYVPIAPEFVDRSARLAYMDANQVERSLIFPTLGVCVEHFMPDAEALYVNFTAFNRWLEEDWGYAWNDRIYAAPMLSLIDLELAVRELQRVIDLGARVISLRPGPAYGRSPADPYFDPFWALANEAGLTIAFHIGESGYNEMFSTAWGEAPNPSSHQQSAFQWVNFYGDRPIMDTLSALVLHNLFGRFPRLRAYSVENGSLWVPYLMKAMDKMSGMGRNGPWLGGRLNDRPSRVFQQFVYVSPYHEESLPPLVDMLGTERVVFGSDFPHAEGLAHPSDYFEELSTIPTTQHERVMRENALDLVTA